MLSLFATVIELYFTARIRLSKLSFTLLSIGFVVSVFALVLLTAYGLCNAMVLVVDIVTALTILIILKKNLS